MATVAMLVGGAIINALAFSGLNYLFSQLSNKSVDKEQKRHDKALEQLQATQADYTQHWAEHLDWINEELRRQQHVAHTFQDADAAMHEYAMVTGKTLDPLGSPPKLSNLYMLSDDQKNREIAFIILAMVEMGLAAYKLL